MNKTGTSLLLGCTLSSGALLAPWPQPTQAVPLAKAARAARPSSSSCANPRGVRLTLHSSFTVTNSDDGFKDKDVEVFGFVKIRGQLLWNVARKNALTIIDQETHHGPGIGTTGTPSNQINIGIRTFDVIFDKPATWKVLVSGYMHDRDAGSSDDVLWNAYKMPHVIDIKALYERRKARQGGAITLAGDRDSESADLRIGISESEDIF